LCVLPFDSLWPTANKDTHIPSLHFGQKFFAREFSAITPVSYQRGKTGAGVFPLGASSDTLRSPSTIGP